MLRNIDDRVFLVFLAVASIAMAWIALPFFGSILWAMITAIVFSGLNHRIYNRMPRFPNLAAFLTLLAIILIVIVPAIFVSSLLVDEAIDTYRKIQSQQIDFGKVVRDLWSALPETVREQLERFGMGDLSSIQKKLSEVVTGGLSLVTRQAVSVGQGAFNFFLALGIMLYLTFFLLRDGHTLRERVAERMPLRSNLQRDLFDKFTTVIRATIKGSVVVAIVQGLLGGVTFWLLGVEGSLLWGVVMGFFSLIPAIGTGIVWVPVAAYLFASGQFTQGVILVLCGVFLIGMVDNVLRPLLVGKDTRMPDYVVLIATLGGISVLGINGFVIGPVIAAMFIAAWDVVGKARQEMAESPAKAPKKKSQKTLP